MEQSKFSCSRRANDLDYRHLGMCDPKRLANRLDGLVQPQRGVNQPAMQYHSGSWARSYLGAAYRLYSARDRMQSAGSTANNQQQVSPGNRPSPHTRAGALISNHSVFCPEYPVYQRNIQFCNMMNTVREKRKRKG